MKKNVIPSQNKPVSSIGLKKISETRRAIIRQDNSGADKLLQTPIDIESIVSNQKR